MPHAQTPVRFRWVAGLLLMMSLVAGTALAQPTTATVSAQTQPASVKPGEAFTLEVSVAVAEGYHAQSHTPTDENYIPLTVEAAATGITFDAAEYPKGKTVDYPLLGKLNVYTGTVVVRLPAKLAAGATGTIGIAGTVHYQACDDNACFPPTDLPFQATVTVEGTPAGTAVTPPPATLPAAAPSGPPTASIFGIQVATNALFVPLLLAFVVGICFNVVPCVLPVMPLKIIGFYEAAKHDRAKCLLLGLAFSVGLVASFAVLAVLVFGIGAITWGGLFTQTWFTVVVVVVLTLMAASQFGLFTVNLPMQAYAFSPRHDTLVGNALFGVLTAALSTPCTIGPFSGVLAVAAAQPPALGALLIVVVGCGMAAPYLILSAFPEVMRRFPRTGPLGEIVKQSLAFLVLATAFYFARPLLPHFISPPLFWWTIFALVLAGGAFLVTRTATLVGTGRAIAISSVCAAVVVGGMLYWTLKVGREPYDWLPYSDVALADARRDGRPVLIDFTADWCVNCHYLEAVVIKDPAVVKAVRSGKVLMMKADVTRSTAAAVPLKNKLVSTGEIPLTAVYLPGQSDPALLKGVYSAGDLLAKLPG